MRSRKNLKLFLIFFTLPQLFLNCVARSPDMESPSTGEARSKMATEKTGKPPQTLEIVKPRDEAIEYIEDTCKNDYEILSERVESTEIGMSVPIGQPAKVRWLIRYHCGHTAP